MTRCRFTRTVLAANGNGYEVSGQGARTWTGVGGGCTFAVIIDGEPVGMQDLIGAEFAAFATVSTFSWLGPGYRGRGIGTEMRAAALHLAFAGLAARLAPPDAPQGQEWSAVKSSNYVRDLVELWGFEPLASCMP
jgi:GNAT superfamily N-acetyltransferase